MALTITVRQGHLTQADKKNVKALLAYEGFAYGQQFKVGPVKEYRIEDLADATHAVYTTEWAQTWEGRKRDTHRAVVRFQGAVRIDLADAL